MDKKIKNLKNILKKSQNILIITHKGPDIDAFCSMLTVFEILKQIFPSKNIQMQTKQNPSMNLPGMKNIQIRENIDNTQFDTLIITDASDIDMCKDPQDILTTENKNILIIDHHDTIVSQPENTLLFNNNASSATEEIYTLFSTAYRKHFKITEDIAQLIQYGIIADTGRFLYDITTPNSLRIFADMMEISPIDIEDFSYKKDKFPKESTIAIQEYLKTLTIEGDMAYMYIDRKTIDQNPDLKKGVSEAQAFLRDKYLRYIQGVHWGFIIKPDNTQQNNWFVSFRSTKGYQDVKIIAEELGGGGHIYASGVPMQGDSLDEILDKVLSVARKYL